MVEFSLMATVFLLIMLGTMQLGIAVFRYNTICYAAREAVRYAIVHSSTSPNPATGSQIQQAAINAAPGLGLSSSNISVSWPADPNFPTKQDAQVLVSYQYQLQLPFLAPLTLTLSSTSQMLVSQ